MGHELAQFLFTIQYFFLVWTIFETRAHNCYGLHFQFSYKPSHERIPIIYIDFLLCSYISDDECKTLLFLPQLTQYNTSETTSRETTFERSNVRDNLFVINVVEIQAAEVGSKTTFKGSKI